MSGSRSADGQCHGFCFLTNLRRSISHRRRTSTVRWMPVGEDDRLAVSRMFRFVFDVVEKLSPGFQVVITEHADINEDWYQGAVVERWRGGLKLIPDDWPKTESRNMNREE